MKISSVAIVTGAGQGSAVRLRCGWHRFHADSKASPLFLPSRVVGCASSLLVRQSRQRHPLVPWSGTGSAWGRPAHQQSCPGVQVMGDLHCEQKAFMVGAF